MVVAVLGPVPPPVDGRAVATGWLLDNLRRDNHEVRVFDTHVSAVAKAVRCLQAAALLLCGVRMNRFVVVASGDLGLVVEALPLLAARIRGVATVMTHHSARYVRERSRLFRMALWAAGPGLRHAVLDPAMGAEMSRAYGIGEDRITVVDNAGLMPASGDRGCVAAREGAVHLSNLSVAKGLSAVLEVAARSGVRIRLIGTVSPDAEEVLARARRDGVPFECLGPRHGAAKYEALSAARCFVFLSTYAHEAQPLVLYEAMDAGCVPVVWDTGWIGAQMRNVGLDEHVFVSGDVDGVTAAITRILSMDEESFEALSDRVRTAFDRHRDRTAAQFRSVVGG